MVVPNPYIESPMLVGGPLILNPKFFSPSYGSTITWKADDRPRWIPHPISCKRKESRFVNCFVPLYLKTGIQKMLGIQPIHIDHSNATGIGPSILTPGGEGLLRILDIAEYVQGIRRKVARVWRKYAAVIKNSLSLMSCRQTMCPY